MSESTLWVGNNEVNKIDIDFPSYIVYSVLLGIHFLNTNLILRENAII